MLDLITLAAAKAIGGGGSGEFQKRSEYIECEIDLDSEEVTITDERYTDYAEFYADLVNFTASGKDVYMHARLDLLDTDLNARLTAITDDGEYDFECLLDGAVAFFAVYSSGAYWSFRSIEAIDDIQEAIDDDDLSSPASVGGIAEYCQKKTSVTELVAPTSLTLADNTEYYLTNVSDLSITYPSGRFESWIRLTTATSGTVTIELPTSQYIGTAPTFGNGETWEISIKDGVVAAAKVGDGE